MKNQIGRDDPLHVVGSAGGLESSTRWFCCFRQAAWVGKHKTSGPCLTSGTPPWQDKSS